MAVNINTRSLDALAGAVYFTVGRGTEGGSASYRLSIAGVDRSEWGKVGAVAANSGYSMGTIQVDFGQRGTWPLGSIENRALGPGEKTYVDSVIEQAAAYAQQNSLKFTDDKEQLRADLLSHGNGKAGRSSITFIDVDTRNSINAWASSDEGKKWIHKNIDYPQVRNATLVAVSILDRNSHKVSADDRFEAINILAKTANQFPSQLKRLESVLKNDGDYEALLNETKAIEARCSFYDGPKAASMARAYESSYNDPGKQSAMDRAHLKVSNPNFDPMTEASDPDIRVALGAIGQRSRASATRDPNVERLQQNLSFLGIPDANGRPLAVDGAYGSRTKEAIESFQRQHSMPVDGKATPQVLVATQIAVSAAETLRNAQQFGQQYGVQPLHTASEWPGVPYAGPTQSTATRPAERIAAANAQFGDVRVHVDTTGQKIPEPAERAPAVAPLTPPGLDRAVVETLQQNLNRLGITDLRGRPLTDDGRYGPNTQAAVSVFQHEQGLPATGIADNATLSAINAHVIVADLQRQKTEREAHERFQKEVQAYDARMVEPAPSHDPLGRETATLHAVQHPHATGMEVLRGTTTPPFVSQANRPIEAPAPEPHRAADRADYNAGLGRTPLAQPEPESRHESQRELLSYADPSHPHHPLFQQLRDKLPANVSDDKVAELTLAAREGGVRPNRVQSVDIYRSHVLVQDTFPMYNGLVDLRTPAPPMAETMQRAEDYEQQEAQWVVQRQQQEQQRQSQSHGRSM